MVLHHVRSHHGFMLAYARALIAKLTGPVALFLISGTVTVICAVATLFHWAESGENPNLGEWFDALYLTVTTMTGVGYGDITPVTRAGRVLAMAAMLGGTALFAGYTALVASAIIEVGRDPRWTDEKE